MRKGICKKANPLSWLVYTSKKPSSKPPAPLLAFLDAEIALLETRSITLRSSLSSLLTSLTFLVLTPIEEHSKKPAIVRDKIVDLVGDLPRIELFARQTAEGWDCWGNEV